ncbi:hypothetical protein LJC59_06200 [Desulfovibrio sp. OttesenSCG-928-A18]|nr:hypothetical protein [Desulfovibrio sp. OttesenSCG-928-A18]
MSIISAWGQVRDQISRLDTRCAQARVLAGAGVLAGMTGGMEYICTARRLPGFMESGAFRSALALPEGQRNSKENAKNFVRQFIV